jgi:hypothetical protein
MPFTFLKKKLEGQTRGFGIAGSSTQHFRGMENPLVFLKKFLKILIKNHYK